MHQTMPDADETTWPKQGLKGAGMLKLDIYPVHGWAFESHSLMGVVEQMYSFRASTQCTICNVKRKRI